MTTGRYADQERSTRERCTELTDRELRTIRGGDECLVGFSKIDLDGDDLRGVPEEPGQQLARE